MAEAAVPEIDQDSEYAMWVDRPLWFEVHAPDQTTNAPLVIHLTPAAPDPAYVDGLVDAGAIVFVAEVPGWGNRPAWAFDDSGAGVRVNADSAACAIRTARARAADLGSEDPLVVISGLSQGGGVAAHAALTGANLEQKWDDYATAGGPARQVECAVAEGSTGVDALVGMAGAYDLFVPIYDGAPGGMYKGGYGRSYQQETNPELLAFLSEAIGANPDLPVRLFHGQSDMIMPVENSVGFAEALEDAGYDVKLEIVDGPHTELAENSVPIIADLMRQ